MKFAVIGTGGVGGFFGGKLAQAGNEVGFLARGEHLRKMRSNGLRIIGTGGEFTIPPGTMTQNPAGVGTVDVILFCVKSYDTEEAAKQLAPHLSDKTIIISLQNGIDNEEKIQQFLPEAIVYGGISNIYSTVTGPGEITETGGPQQIIFGRLPTTVHRLEIDEPLILETMLAAGIRAELSVDMLTDLWRKFIFITAVGGLTALTRLPLSEILACEESHTLLIDAMKETQELALVQNIPVEENFIQKLLERLNRVDTNTRSSLYYDLVHEKPLEIEAFSGTILRYGKKLGVPTPIHTTIYASLLPYHLRHLKLRENKLS